MIAIILALFSSGYLVLAFDIPSFSVPRPVDSDLFPKILGFILLILSIFLFFDRKEYKDQEEEEETQVQQKEGKQRFATPRMQVFVTLVAIALYIFLFEILGFLLVTLLFTFGMTFYYGYRRHVVNFIVSLSVSLFFYLLLTRFMGIYLPEGIIPI
ncbi:tripartite tricarboxylate transporter TctB family protein [Salicibibacter kimchii]|uniref:Tripartite tricarboxylate transporter TctB family protein n=2 Tax=Salicibibacter kimchii TaxID=2099786 RepID=A0A345C3V8_9BACI|nr:tripartite tricarboxylate transporter TctB family protein [Salicibibacter kimchii]